MSFYLEFLNLKIFIKIQQGLKDLEKKIQRFQNEVDFLKQNLNTLEREKEGKSNILSDGPKP